VQREVSKSVRKAILKNHLQGMNQVENLRSINSSGTDLTIQEINSVIDEFGVESEGKGGLEKATKDLGISNIARELGEVARFKRENKVQYSEMIEGGKIAAALKKFGADIPEFEQFLQSVYSRSLEKGYTPKEIISQSAKLESLEKKYSKKFDQLIEEYDEVGKEFTTRKKEKASVEQEIEILQKKKSNILAANSLDEQTMREFIKTREELQLMGLNISELISIRNFLVAIKNEKFDSKTIIDKLNSLTDLQAQKTKIQAEVGKAKQELDEKKTLVAELRKLSESKLSVDQVERIRGIVNRISVDNKIDSSQAFSKFEQDILVNYNSVLGLRPEASRLEDNKKRIEADIDSKRKELDSIESGHLDKIKKLEEKYAKQKDVIQSYNELLAQGIDGKRILAWNQIIKASNLDFGMIESELRNQGNLRGLEDKAGAKIKDLVAEELKLTQSITNLNKEKLNVESSIKALKDSALGEIEAMKSKIISTISSINDQTLSKFSATLQENQKLLQTATSQSQKEIEQIAEASVKDIKTTATDLKTTATDFTMELKTLVEKAGPEIKNVGLALDAGEKIGKYRNILPILQLIDDNGKGDESEAMIAMWNLTSRFNTWLESHYPQKAEISQILTKMMASINDEIQKVGGD